MDLNFLLALGTTLVAVAAYITTTAVLSGVTRRDLKDFKDDVRGKFAAMDSRFTAMDSKFAAMDSRFAAMDDKFAAMDNKFAAMDSRFTAMDAKFAAMDAKFEQSFVPFENRLDSLEKDVAVIRAICEERSRNYLSS